VILLSGKLYYDLVRERQTRGLDSRVCLIRIEELSPFPFAELDQTLGRYSNANEVYWVQEEPKNQGAFTHVEPRINSLLVDKLKFGKRLIYHGREADSVPAPGIGRRYAAQQEKVMHEAFRGL
jgi:probable 2-oxoglutarate dehydrogenase E1 component DHKTD1